MKQDRKTKKAPPVLTITGRLVTLATDLPNLQNLVTRTELGRKIRAALILRRNEWPIL